MSLQFKAGVRIISLMFLIALTSCTTWAPPHPSPWLRRPNAELRTREHLTAAEVEALIEAGGIRGGYSAQSRPE